MDVKIVERTATPWVGFHLVGPFEETAPEGFTRLTAWAGQQGISGEWMGIYHGNPNKVAASQLEIDTVIGVEADFDLPAAENGPHKGVLAGGKYAVARVIVEDGDFAKHWLTLFEQWLPTSGWQVDDRPCFDHYLNDGSQSGVWDVDLYIPVKK
ncbi:MULTISPECIES: GyrI-like domain-containing protein [unclassified Pantoea]|jgi:DNA gyrase inhibitor|uniref:GyrI-like domain-containing protein n=1 Tax=unclassified Pantoea TaxID=2630326 RepID=UPI001FA946A0|nr:GyrI-like domain-containing protein [Pantoea sp. MQR6]